MKSVLASIALALLFTFGVGASTADAQSRIIYQHKNWQVKLVKISDHYECQARVSSGDGSFSIWSSPGRGLQLHFYSRSWSFGDSHRQDIKVRIDSRPSWNLRNAKLRSKSIFFYLPNSSSGSRFLSEVRYGSRLKLYNARGNYVRGFSLSGSNASISQLARCVRILRERGAGGVRNNTNPFD